ncbi:hypothetical protein BDZ45DRAFT_733278 [Acephala macrosclerotiorum]|nr:hypothetical protein BDZ45DRAFT_733278 [Acephala macrosclerotiorum]
MLDLPAEVYDHIAAQLEVSNPSIFENWNYNAPLCQGLEFLLAYPKRRSGRPDIKSLQNLRLASRNFHRAATRVLFRSTCMKWFVASRDWQQNPENDSSSSELSTSSLIKHIELDFKDRNGWQLQLSITREEDEVDSAGFLLKINKLFKDVTQLSNLQSLKVDVPLWKSEYNPEPSNGHEQLNLDILQAFTQRLSQILAEPEQWKHLRDLRLALPCSHDFLQLSRTISDGLLARLDRLSLTVTDATGPDGAKQYLEYADEDGSGQDVFPHSNLQVLYPNSIHSHGIFNIVSRCPNLKGLGIKGTHHLDANGLDWGKNASLKNLYLKRVKISAEKLISLWSIAEPDQVSTLSYVWLEDIELTAGTWAEVFLNMETCPSLEYLNPVDLGYARDGRSADHRPWSLWGGHHHEDVTNLWSTNEEDEDSLIALVEKLVGKAGGPDSYPNLFEEQMMLNDEELEN